MVQHSDDSGPKRRPGQAGKDLKGAKSTAGEKPAVKDRPFAKDRFFKREEPAEKDGDSRKDNAFGKDRKPGKFGDKPGKGPRAGKDAKPEGTGKPSAKPTGRGERIAKALARAGVASRRDVERLISLGKVVLNGRVIDTPATFVHKQDELVVDGKLVGSAEATRVWRYNKPVGLVTSHRDPEGRPTVFDALPKGLPRVISVGRLDLNSEGLLLLTNDGGLSRGLELPTSGWNRTYRVRAHGRVEQKDLDRLKDGIEVDGVRYGSIEAKLDKAKPAAEGGSNAWITVTLKEGKNREIRKVFEAIGLRVNRLMRVAYGPFQLGTLGLGEIEEIGPRVIREQLAELIEPQNLPTGDKVLHAPPAPSRRPIPKSGLANPRAKPSRVKANIALREEADAEKKAAGGPRVFVGERAERGRGGPRRDGPRREGDRPYRPRESGDERPRAFKPREGATDRPRTYKPREGGDDKPRGFKPRGEGSERPYRPREGAEDRPRGPRTFKPREGDNAERRDAKKPGWAKANPPRPRGDGDKKPFKPREGSSEGFRPRAGARPDDTRPAGPREDGERRRRPYPR
jgi:23S rRNA pseudouridine2605 synthase